jgi:hypothetical protein
MAVHKARPAETVGAAAGTGGIVAALAAHNWLALGLACVGYLPAVVTFTVTHGGLSGLWRLVWKGRP